MAILDRRKLVGLFAAFATMSLSASVHAESDWPTRPVKVIVAFPAGQSTDIATRYFADKLSHAFGQPFVVENRAGASGNIGTAYAARATPDGYTLIMGASGTHAMNPALYSNIGFDAEKDFDPIILTALIPFAISTGPDSSINSLSDLVAHAKDKSGQIDAAIPSVTGQLVLEMLKQRDIPLYGVRYKGSADSMTAVLGGHVPILIDTVAATRTQLGKIRPLAITTASPMDSMPGVKTASEQGLTGFTLAAWNALMVPHGVPAQIQQKLATEMRKILDMPETQKALEDRGFATAPPLNQEQLAAWLNEERRSYAKTIKAANMQIN